MLTKPTSFAFCLLTSNPTLSKQQINKAKNSFLSKSYNIEYWERSYKNPNQYSGFSHMINEAIDDTDNEFMVFLSEKTSFEPQDIEDIITKLCLGYCFVAPVSLGLFGVTKEVFRNIGMFDERFIGGEMEDDDLAMRLNMLNKAIYWTLDSSKYNSSKYNCPLIRGTSTGEFFKKWNIRFNEETKTREAFISKYNVEKKIALRHSKRRLDIYKSWKSKAYSKYKEIEGFPATKVLEYNIQKIDYKEEQQLCNCNIKAKVSREQTYVNYSISNDNTYPLTFSIHAFDGTKRYPVASKEIYPNTWNKFDYKHIDEEHYEIRIYGDGILLYNNVLKEDFEFNLNINIFRSIKPVI